MGAAAAIAAFASALQGRQQGQASNDAYRQQLQQQQADQLLKTQEYQARLKAIQDQNAATDALPPDLQVYTKAGLGPQYMEQQGKTRGSQMTEASFRALASQENDPKKQMALNLAGDMAKAGASESTINEMLRVAGVGGAAGNNELSQYMAAHPGTSFDDAVKGLNTLKMRPTAPSWRTETTPDGRTIQVPYERDASGNLVRVPFANGDPAAATGSIPGKLNTNQQKLVDSVNDIDHMMPDLKDMIAGLGNPSSYELLFQYAKYRAPGGLLGDADPKFVAYFNALGQVQTDLVSSATSSGSRSFQLISMLKPHIPDPTDPPSRAIEKLNGFDKGRFAAIKATLLGQPASVATNPAKTAPTGTPVYVGVKVVGYTTDGKTMTPVTP